ncbi:GntR family transcriptional regulator [Cupriavidus taiwanensis]|uniref:GntR family transcriptional regulator n=1 Tax=Cupriavidus taiwanensis TaxID=164546 RepID=UPI001571BFC1|nr:GntR family transcriptional regulator [Cupriavidus taiwanensis]MDK3021284.1 GntR family transcriptional regulator [Cupriavidus taiwanensis]NSX14115.1 GntR family transcriptional regulator [Cupriavidus taiwanensis]
MDARELLDGMSVYSRMREAILSGRLSAGARLVSQRLAGEFGVSRTPVKEALARLEGEGLVVREGNWGYNVRTISLRDAEEIFEARLVIEVASAERAAQRATDDEARAMSRLLRSCHQHLRSENLVEFQHTSRAIHELITQATGNSQLIRMFRQVNDLVILFGISLLRANPYRAQDILKENEAIVEAIQRRDSNEAVRLMRLHIEKGHSSFRQTAASIRPAISLF